jgi:LysM repeat protein
MSRPFVYAQAMRTKWFIIADNFQKEKHTMSVKKLMFWVGVLTLIAAALAMVPATQAQSGNLLQNPSFELPYTDNQQANGWGRYRITIEKPDDASALQYSRSANFSAETNPSGKFPELIHGGSASQHIGLQQDPWIAGVKQVVGNIPAGSQVVFCAFNRIYANNDNYGKAPSVNGYEGRSQVGIFRDGDVTVDTTGVDWSAAVNPHDNWQQLCTPAVTVGGSGIVTVFTRNDWRGYAANHLDSWWDDASLTIQGQAQPTAQPTTPAQPQTQPTAPPAQPLPGGGIVHTVVAGDTLFALSFQYNVSLDDIYALNGLNSQSILSIGQQIIIKAGAGTQVPAQQPTAAPTAAPTQSAEATQQPAEATPQTTPAVEPTAAPTTVAEASNLGTLCLFAYEDANADALRDPGEGPVAGAKFTVVDGQGAVVTEYVSTDGAEPHCVENLTPGSYSVSVQPAPNTTATSDERWGVPLTSGSKVNIDFGSRTGESGTTSTGGSSTSGSSSGGSNIGGIVAGIGGLVLLLAAGVIGAFVIARRRA